MLSKVLEQEDEGYDFKCGKKKKDLSSKSNWRQTLEILQLVVKEQREKNGGRLQIKCQSVFAAASQCFSV